jgi:hypothetical protein
MEIRILSKHRVPLGFSEEEKAMAEFNHGLLKRFRTDGTHVWHIDRKIYAWSMNSELPLSNSWPAKMVVRLVATRMY